MVFRYCVPPPPPPQTSSCPVECRRRRGGNSNNPPLSRRRRRRIARRPRAEIIVSVARAALNRCRSRYATPRRRRSRNIYVVVVIVESAPKINVFRLRAFVQRAPALPCTRFDRDRRASNGKRFLNKKKKTKSRLWRKLFFLRGSTSSDDALVQNAYYHRLDSTCRRCEKTPRAAEECHAHARAVAYVVLRVSYKVPPRTCGHARDACDSHGASKC